MAVRRAWGERACRTLLREIHWGAAHFNRGHSRQTTTNKLGREQDRLSSEQHPRGPRRNEFALEEPTPYGGLRGSPVTPATPAVIAPISRPHWPTGSGFEHFYGFISGEANQYYPGLYESTTPVEPPRTPEEGLVIELITNSYMNAEVIRADGGIRMPPK